MIEVSVGLIVCNNNVLLQSRPNGKFMANYWEFPGGKLELNESPEYCLFRELQEELGINIDPPELIDSIVQTYPDKVIKLSIFIVNSYTGEVSAKEGQLIFWLDLNNLDDLPQPSLPSTKIILQKVFK